MSRRKTKSKKSNKSAAPPAQRFSRTPVGRHSGGKANPHDTLSAGDGVFNSEDLRQMIRRASTENRPALIGLGLSLLQFLGHVCWVALTQYAVSSGTAKQLTSADPLAWTIVISMGLSMLLTLVAMFVCLFFGLRREPRVFAVMGLLLSFFSGAFATFAILLG